MKPFVKLSTGKTTTLLVIMFVLSAAVVAARNWHTFAAKAEIPTPVAGPNAPSHTLFNQRNRITGESITLTPRGFEPAEISRGPGRFVLNINNRSGIHEVRFLLTPESGNRLREVQFAKGKISSRELLDLSPGRYRLTEVNHPGWVCQIEISAR